MEQYTVYATLEIKADGKGASEQEVLDKALKSKKYEIVNSYIGSRAIDNYITIAEYARRHGLRDCIYLGRLCNAGKMPGAVRIGRDWCIPADTPRTDNRIKSGKYIGQHKQYYDNKKFQEAALDSDNEADE